MAWSKPWRDSVSTPQSRLVLIDDLTESRLIGEMAPGHTDQGVILFVLTDVEMPIFTPLRTIYW